MRVLWRSATPLAGASVGLFAGLVAFLLSCLGGHPLMVPEASYPFWMALGLAAAPRAEEVEEPQIAARALRIWAAAALLLFALTLPYRIAESARTADMSNASLARAVAPLATRPRRHAVSVGFGAVGLLREVAGSRRTHPIAQF
jgi:hypothetical protein